MNLIDTFEKYNDEFCKFENVQNKLSNRPDLHAFILLDKLVPGNSDIISASEHDEFYLDIDIQKLEQVITEEQIVDLVRCGVRYDTGYDCLSMFA
jgi:hypothetical protein